MRSGVRLRVECALPERLISQALREGVVFSGIERLDARRLIMETDTAGAATLLALCRRYAIHAAVLERRGLSALIPFVRRRWTLAIGLLVCAIACALFLGRIWRVDLEFTGDGSASNALRGEIMRKLSEQGVHPGIDGNIDTALLSEVLSAEIDGCGFISARRQGIRLLIEAAPETEPPELYDVEAPRDLVAARDGVVVSASARSGELCVQVGDTVRRGQLLVRGEEMAADGETRPIAALGKVVIRTWFSGVAELPLTAEVIRDTGRRRVKSRLVCAGFSAPIVDCEDFARQREAVETLPIGGLFLPLEIVRTTLIEVSSSERAIDPSVVEARASALALADAAARLTREGPSEYEISRVWVNCARVGTARLRAEAIYEIIADTAVTREALLQGG